MRIVISILAFIVGIGCVAYSYVGAFVTLAGEIERDIDGATPFNAIGRIVSFISSGEIPQLTGYLYGGALLIVLAVVNLLLNNPKDADSDDAD